MFYNVVSVVFINVFIMRPRIRSEVKMKDDKKEFTLKQMTEVFKRGWLTMLIYVLVAAIVFGSVAAIVKTVGTTNEYRAKIGFVSTVDDDMLVTLNSSENITKALTDLGMKEEEIPSYVDGIRAAISITPIVYSNQTDTETQFVPSSYTVTMSEIAGLSEAKCTQILNQIITNFIEAYNLKNTSTSITTENEQAFADFSSSDYVEIAYELNKKLETMISTSKSLASRSTTFVSTSTNMTFADFISLLESLQSQLETFDGYVTVKGITKTSAGLTASEYIAMRITIAENDKTKAEDTATKYKEVIDQVTSNGIYSGTVDGQTIVIQDQASYFNFLNRYLEAVSTSADVSAVYNYWLNKQTTFNSATAFPNASAEEKANYIAEANKKVDLLVTSSVQMIEIYNNMVKDYNKSGLSSASSANLITPAYVYSTSAMSNTVMLLIIALAVLLAAMIGFVRARNRYLAALDKETPSLPDEPSNPTPAEEKGTN